MDQHLKQRLVGAIVIVSLAVIFIPVILEGPDDDWSPRVQDMPAPPRIDYPAAAAVQPPPPALSQQGSETYPPVRQSAKPLPAPIAASNDVESTAVVPEPAPAAPPEPKPEPKPAPKPAVAPTPSGGWLVQVGSFSQQLNAQGLRDRLTKAGHPATVRDVKTAKGRIYRVFVGPLKDRGAAEKLRDNLSREYSLKGMVVQNTG